MSFLVLQRTIRLKFICFSAHSDSTGLHDTVLIHVVTLFVYFDPAGLHDTVLIEIIFFMISVGKPSGVRLSVNQKHPAASVETSLSSETTGVSVGF